MRKNEILRVGGEKEKKLSDIKAGREMRGYIHLLEKKKKKRKEEDVEGEEFQNADLIRSPIRDFILPDVVTGTMKGRKRKERGFSFQLRVELILPRQCRFYVSNVF